MQVWLAHSGDRFLCVRSRAEVQRKKRCKTVEVMIAERNGDPPPPRASEDTRVGGRVGVAEVEARHRVKQAGGQWNGSRMVWETRNDQVVALEWEGRLVAEGASHRRDPGYGGKHLYVDAQEASICRCLYLVLDASIYY